MSKSNENLSERIVLIAYIVYTAAVISAAMLYNWESWAAPLLLLAAVSTIAMFARKFRSYFFRAFFMSIAAWVTFTIDVAHSNGFVESFSMAAVIIVLLAVYCVPELSYVSAAIFSFHIIYHLEFARDLEITPDSDGMLILVRTGAVYMIIILTHIMLRSRLDTGKDLMENIDSISRAERSKDDFLANVSHEIRTPVNTICGISEIILREELPEQVREEINDIQTAGRSLLSIVSDILDFTELSSGRSMLSPVTYNITSTINDVLNMSLAGITDRRLEFIVDVDPNIPCGLVGDEEKIRRAILNVMDNAVKFTKEGGIIFSVRYRPEEYGINLVITVKDTGIGMNDEALENLFTSYSQVDTKRSRMEEGLGLGLTITKSVINKMGGFISVRSELGKGTEVKMVIPQNVIDEDKIIAVDDPENIRVLLYIDMDKYQYSEVRDGYLRCIHNIIENLQLNVCSCHSLGEFKRRAEKENYTHAFISWEEYSLDKKFFDALAERITVVLVLDRDHKESVGGARLLCVYKPFYVLPIAAVLNGRYADTLTVRRTDTRFTAPSAKVLIVDDNLMNLKVTEGLLRPYKIKVFLAGSGKDCLKKLETIKPDIIFMDHMMPGMDGVETFHRIRAKTGMFFQNVPIVALTANAIGGAREMFLNEGFADYITKPIELSSLERVLRTYIPDRKIIRSTDAPVNKPEVSSGEIVLSLEGINVRLGIEYCSGNLDDYIDVVRVYYEIGMSRVGDIRRYFEEKDWENYTITVHAVKSTSLNIGAEKLSAMAERLESAGKRHKTDEIETNTDAMLAEYERVLRVLRDSREIFPEIHPSLSASAELRELTAEELSVKLDELAAALDTFETETVKKHIDELMSCTYGGRQFSEQLSSINEKVIAFDFIGAAEELEVLRRNVR